jgi:hypothetical protein
MARHLRMNSSWHQQAPRSRAVLQICCVPLSRARADLLLLLYRAADNLGSF